MPLNIAIDCEIPFICLRDLYLLKIRLIFQYSHIRWLEAKDYIHFFLDYTRR